MKNGYWQRMLRIDLAKRKTRVEEIQEKDLREFIGGQVPLQRCWAHKIRNLLNHVKRVDQEKVKTGLPLSALRTTNAIEPRFREVRRRSRSMGTFSDRTSMERILYSIFTHENLKQRTATPFLLLTQNN